MVLIDGNYLYPPDASASAANRTGHCPVRGMALEPEMPSELEDETATQRVRNRFWIALALTLPVVAMAMVPHFFDIELSNAAARWLRGIELLLSGPVVLWAALDYYRRTALIFPSGGRSAGWPLC